jgi:2-polyprenyl-3-methyl-5-hydroxy-6-metoxy-1,4-benzoquinol methylase
MIEAKPNNTSTTECYLCKNKKFEQRIGRVRDNSKLKVLECTSCGLVFLSSFDHIKDDFYKNSGMHGNTPVDIKAWVKETEFDDERRFQFLKPLLPNRSVLDIGCGTGSFLSKAKKLASTVYGVELETRLADHFRQLELTIYKNISEIPSQHKYDIITLFHVLEHFPDPRASLIELSKLLEEEGQIIIEVPNSDDALLTLYQSDAFSCFTYWSCHLFLFNMRTLKMLANQAGLNINYIKQIQRYTLANHMFWLSKSKPNGHRRWHFLNSLDLHAAYETQLAALGKCDTIIMSLSF